MRITDNEANSKEEKFLSSGRIFHAFSLLSSRCSFNKAPPYAWLRNAFETRSRVSQRSRASPRRREGNVWNALRWNASAECVVLAPGIRNTHGVCEMRLTLELIRVAGSTRVHSQSSPELSLCFFSNFQNTPATTESSWQPPASLR